MEPRGQELIDRYKRNYKIPTEAPVTEQMILSHWDLEKKLTAELLQSSPENRWEVFDRCYTTLYAELDWLNRLPGQTNAPSRNKRFDSWAEAIGPAAHKLYEIGSGKGELIGYLADRGITCRGTEITRERGAKHVEPTKANISWSICDGVNIAQFEPRETYDVVVSDQVIEHLHPRDLDTHMSNVRMILKPKGRYLFATPHRLTGPHDVSKVFDRSVSAGMHLKEYSYAELIGSAKRAGYTKVYSAFFPGRLGAALHKLKPDGFGPGFLPLKAYVRLQLVMEVLLSAIPGAKLRRKCAITMRKLQLFADDICLIAEK